MMENLSEEEQWVLNVLMARGPLNTGELRSLPGSILPRGMPGHYVLSGLEEMGLIEGRLPNRNFRMRVYHIIEEDE